MSKRWKKMNKRQRNRTRHAFSGELTWDESAMVCRRCSQFEDSWQHTPKVPWWKVWSRG